MPKLKNSNVTSWVIFKHCVARAYNLKSFKLFMIFRLRPFQYSYPHNHGILPTTPKCQRTPHDKSKKSCPPIDPLLPTIGDIRSYRTTLCLGCKWVHWFWSFWNVWRIWIFGHPNLGYIILFGSIRLSPFVLGLLWSKCILCFADLFKILSRYRYF